ncbi:MAG: NADH:flavin oxidoreductase [Deltaproteobacteria bacterium]|nr:NADH:flavin oxidoreductase [Deltaproteobacteria bacterium]
MAVMFSPVKIGSMTVSNRFVLSATYEAMATETGEVTDDLIGRYRTLAKAGTGLIIPGYFFVHPLGKAAPKQAGIHSDDMIPGLKRLVEAVHEHGAKIALQLVHGGMQTGKANTGRAPLGPSGGLRNPMTLEKCREMTPDEIEETIQAFAQGARRAAETGADAVQIHGAHGYLISEFLSPFFNQRQDEWGGSDERRFGLVKAVIQEIRKRVPEDLPILIKLNTNDFTPKPGVTPPLAKTYAGWLRDMGIDGVELSCGTFFTLHMVRGKIPAKEIVKVLPFWMRPFARLQFRRLRRSCGFSEAYNLPAAEHIKPALGPVPLMLVGGVRRLSQMEKLVAEGYPDLISMSRPFIREPYLVKRFKEGKAKEAACISCNKCFAAVANNLPVRCYVNGLPI